MPPFLLRDGAPPLPEALPAYVFTLSVAEGTARGRGTVTVPNPTGAPLADLPFQLHGNDGPRANTSVGAVAVADRAFTVDADARSLVVHLDPPLAPGESVTVAFEWTVAVEPLPADANDLFAQGFAALAGPSSSFGLQASGEGVTVLASAFPMLAPFVGGAPAPRMVRPDRPVGDLAWNTPARWDVTVEAPGTVVTNLADTREGAATRARGEGPWDLVVVVLDDAVAVEEVVDGVRLRSVALRQDAAAGRAVLAEGKRALRFLGRYGAYPYRELDLVEASLIGGAGGVEFGGLALVAAFLYRPLPPSPLSATLGELPAGNLTELRGFVVAHEVAHQWAPGLVVSDAWAAPVVDEPLAQYLAWRALADGLPAAAADGLFERQITTGYASMRLLGRDDGPAARETTAFPDTLAYGGLVYGKAPHLYRALERRHGAPALDAAIRGAVADRAWTVTPPEVWLDRLEAHGATGAREAAATWWSGASGDADLGLDPEGHAALRMMLGPAAGQVEAMTALLGTTPAAWFAAMGAAMGGAPGPR